MDDSRAADQHLSVDTVSRVVEEQFPMLAPLPICRWGGGWDHELFAVGEDWILRFPKRAERVAWLVREIDVMSLVSTVLDGLVARFELVGRPGAGCPYPFVGYRRVIGVGADRARHAGQALAADIGRALSRLHQLPIDRLPAEPDEGPSGSDDQLTNELVTVAGVVELLLSPELLVRARPYLDGQRPHPMRREPRRVIHNDICPDHLIIDPDNGRLAGIVDFSDATIGDPVHDIVGLIGLGGYPFIAEVLAAYDLELGDNFADSLVWRARTLTLIWLADAAAHDPADLAKHLAWVTAAFAEPPHVLA